MSIASVLRGELPPGVKEAAVRKYHRDYMRSRDDLKARDAERKAELYAHDPDYRERRKAAERERRANMTAEQRAADYARRKARLMKLSPEEYARRLNAAAQRTRRWRQKQKEQTNG